MLNQVVSNADKFAKSTCIIDEDSVGHIIDSSLGDHSRYDQAYDLNDSENDKYEENDECNVDHDFSDDNDDVSGNNNEDDNCSMPDNDHTSSNEDDGYTDNFSNENSSDDEDEKNHKNINVNLCDNEGDDDDDDDDEYIINDTQIIDDNQLDQDDDNLSEADDEVVIEDIEKFHRSISNQKYGIFNITGIGNWHSCVNEMERMKDHETNVVRLVINERYGTCGGQQYVPLSKVIQKKHKNIGPIPLNSLPSILLSLVENYGQEELTANLQKRIDSIVYHLSDVVYGIEDMQEIQCTGRSEFFNQLNKVTKEITCPLEVLDTIIRVYDKKSLAEFYHHSIKSSTNPILKLMPTHFMKDTSETSSSSSTRLSPEALTALMLHSEFITNELGSAHITGPIMKKLYNFFNTKGFIVAPDAFKKEPKSIMLSLEEQNTSGLLSGLCPTLLSITLDIPPISHSDTSIEGIEFVNGILNFQGKFLNISVAPKAILGNKRMMGRSQIPITTKQHIYFLKGITHKFLSITSEGKKCLLEYISFHIYIVLY